LTIIMNRILFLLIVMNRRIPDCPDPVTSPSN
jgi:hypothetical protein